MNDFGVVVAALLRRRGRSRDIKALSTASFSIRAFLVWRLTLRSLLRRAEMVDFLSISWNYLFSIASEPEDMLALGEKEEAWSGVEEIVPLFLSRWDFDSDCKDDAPRC